MKPTLYVFLLLPGLCRADYTEGRGQDEGEITGEMDGVLIKTSHGSLTINRAEIQEQQAARRLRRYRTGLHVEISSARRNGRRRRGFSFLPEPVVPLSLN